MSVAVEENTIALAREFAATALRSEDEFASGYWLGFEHAATLMANGRMDEFLASVTAPGVRFTDEGFRYSAEWLNGDAA